MCSLFVAFATLLKNPLLYITKYLKIPIKPNETIITIHTAHNQYIKIMIISIITNHTKTIHKVKITQQNTNSYTVPIVYIIVYIYHTL